MTHSSDLAKLRALIEAAQKHDAMVADGAFYDYCRENAIKVSALTCETVPALVSYIETAEKMRERLTAAQEWLIKNGVHPKECFISPEDECTCGLSELRAHLEDSV